MVTQSALDAQKRSSRRRRRGRHGLATNLNYAGATTERSINLIFRPVLGGERCRVALIEGNRLSADGATQGRGLATQVVGSSAKILLVIDHQALAKGRIWLQS